MNTVKIEKGNTLVVAHRGLSGIERENTNAAFVAAGNRSYFGIETDIYRTSDGHFVVSHDANLKRVGGEELVIEEHTLAELQSVVLLTLTAQRAERIFVFPHLKTISAFAKSMKSTACLSLNQDLPRRRPHALLRSSRSLSILMRLPLSPSGTTILPR